MVTYSAIIPFYSIPFYVGIDSIPVYGVKSLIWLYFALSCVFMMGALSHFISIVKNRDTEEKQQKK